MAGRIGGILFIKIDGVQYKAKGEFTYNLGVNKKEMKVGVDGVHGYTEMPQVPFIEGTITADENVDLKTFCELVDGTITLELGNGKVIMLDKAIYAGEGSVTTSEGELAVRFEGESAVEAA